MAYTNISKNQATYTNISKDRSQTTPTIPVGVPIGLLISLTYAVATAGAKVNDFTNISKDSAAYTNITKHIA